MARRGRSSAGRRRRHKPIPSSRDGLHVLLGFFGTAIRSCPAFLIALTSLGILIHSFLLIPGFDWLYKSRAVVPFTTA
jgi:hypothetical protein